MASSEVVASEGTTKVIDLQPTLKHMQDGCEALLEQLQEVDLNDVPSIQKIVSINIRLSTKEHTTLISLLRQCAYVFAWCYKDMPRIDTGLVCHSLNI